MSTYLSEAERLREESVRLRKVIESARKQNAEILRLLRFLLRYCGYEEVTPEQH